MEGVLCSTITVWIGDSDQNKEKTKLFTDARIVNCKRFEKSKVKVIEKVKTIPKLAEIFG